MQQFWEEGFWTAENLVNSGLAKQESLGLPKNFLVFIRTEKVPQRTCATKSLTNFRVNCLVRFASKTLVLLGSALEVFRKCLLLFVHFLALVFLALDL